MTVTQSSQFQGWPSHWQLHSLCWWWCQLLNRVHTTISSCRSNDVILLHQTRITFHHLTVTCRERSLQRTGKDKPYAADAVVISPLAGLSTTGVSSGRAYPEKGCSAATGPNRWKDAFPAVLYRTTPTTTTDRAVKYSHVNGWWNNL